MTTIGFNVDAAMFFAVAVVLVLLLIVLWFVIATAAALRGATVTQPNPIAQMYGYTVCIIAVTRHRTSKTFLTSGILLAVAVLLFVAHWRWLRRLALPATHGVSSGLATFTTSGSNS